MRILPIFFVFALAFQVGAQDEGQNPRLTVGVGISLLNSFKIGNAEEFYQYLMDDQALKVDDGVRGYKYLSVGMFSDHGLGYFGMDFKVMMTHPSRAIWGNDLDFAHMVDMRFGARFYELALKLGPKLGKKGGGIVLEPAVIIGTMSGKIGVTYNATGPGVTQQWTEKRAVGSGFSMAAGIDVPLGKTLLLSFRYGYRSLKIDESHEDATSSTGYSSFYANGTDGDIVKVDWSGANGSVGLIVAFGKRNTE